MKSRYNRILPSLLSAATPSNGLLVSRSYFLTTRICATRKPNFRQRFDRPAYALLLQAGLFFTAP